MRRTPTEKDDLVPEESARRKPRPYVRHGRQRRYSVGRTLVRAAATVIGVSAVSGVAVVAVAASMLVQTAQPSVQLHAGRSTVSASQPSIGALEGGFDLLLVGSDSRQGQGDAFGDPSEEVSVLNDVTMLLHVSADHSNATVVSFPRDLYVDIPACTDPATGAVVPAREDTKINQALGANSSLSCVAATVEQLMGVGIDYGAIVQFNGVIEMSNALGGVDVCIATPIDDDYTGLHLAAGEHELRGVEALQFLRTRHGIGDGSDLTRISNQQNFLSALVRTVKSADTLANPVAMYGLARAALGNMTLSTELNDLNTVVQLGLALQDVDIADVAFVQYPTVEEYGGVVADEAAGAVLAQALQTDRPVALTGGTGAGTVASATDPAATPAATAADPAGPDGDATTGPTGTAPAAGAGATTDDRVALPSTVTGQTADQQTCSVGFAG